MLNLEINNLTKTKIDERELKKIFQKAADVLKLKKKTISLAFISEAEIKKLNKIYRGKNKVTNVLSFASRDVKLNKFVEQPSREKFFGEIIICPLTAKNKAMINKLFIHGLLHLVGYDHDKSEKAEKMEKLEQEITKTQKHNNASVF